MGVLERLKAALGLDADRSDPADASGDGGVRVEHDPDVETEAAVKGVDADDVAGAAEPAEPTDAAQVEDGDDADADGDAASATDATDDPVRDITGIGPTYERRLNDAGVETVADLAAADPGELAERADVGRGRLEKWIDRARAR